MGQSGGVAAIDSGYVKTLAGLFKEPLGFSYSLGSERTQIRQCRLHHRKFHHSAWVIGARLLIKQGKFWPSNSLRTVLGRPACQVVGSPIRVRF